MGRRKMRSPLGFDLRSALAEELRAAAAALDSAVNEPRAVHRCRVHLKRARALSRVGKQWAPGLAKVFNQTARAAMGALAHRRDAAALVEAAAFAEQRARRKEVAALRQLAAAMTHADTAPPPLDLHAASIAIRDLQALAQVWPEASPRQVRTGAKRVARKARRARERAVGGRDVHLRHEWRKREKDRLYAAQILGKAWPGRRSVKSRERLCDLLGMERDTSRLIERLQASAVSAGCGDADARALKALTRQLRKLVRKADALAKRL